MLRFFCKSSSPAWHRELLRNFPVDHIVHPLCSLYEDIVCERYRWVADPIRVELVLDLEQPEVIVWTILRTSEVQRLVRAKVRRIVVVLDIHLGRLQEESVYAGSIFVLIQ